MATISTVSGQEQRKEVTVGNKLGGFLANQLATTSSSRRKMLEPYRLSVFTLGIVKKHPDLLVRSACLSMNHKTNEEIFFCRMLLQFFLYVHFFPFLYSFFVVFLFCFSPHFFVLLFSFGRGFASFKVARNSRAPRRGRVVSR